MQNEYLEPLWNAFDEYADYPAIVDEDGSRSTSYAQLKEAVCRTVAWLREKEIAPGSFVPIVMPTGMEYYAAEIGLWMAGHSAVPMGTAFPPERVTYIREHCDSPLIIDEEAWTEILQTDPVEFENDTPDYPSEELPALLIYTSGSTGNPKGILHTFGGLAVKHTAKANLTYTPDDVWAMGAPPYFVASLTCFKVLKEGGQLQSEEIETAEAQKVMSMPKSLLFLVIGVAGIVIGGDVVVDSASNIALKVGMSQTLVGLTIVSIGTSLPELVTSVVAARKNEVDMALGNAIGSNIFNILLVLGLAGVISPMSFLMENIIDIIILIVFSLLIWIFAWTKEKISRKEGIVMLVLYVVYVIYICMR